MSEIERLAKAQQARYRECDPAVLSWRVLDGWTKEFRMQGVRAVLEAMREPSDAMVKAGETACEALNNGGCRTAAEDAGCAWQAMIDAALREEVPA